MRISDWSSDVCSSDLQPFAESISSKTSQVFVSERMLTHPRPGKADTLLPNPQSDIGVFFPPLRHGCPRYFRNLSRATQRAPIPRHALPRRLTDRTSAAQAPRAPARVQPRAPPTPPN